MPPVGVEAHNMRLGKRPGVLETALGETISHDGRHEPSKCNAKEQSMAVTMCNLRETIRYRQEKTHNWMKILHA